MARTQRKPAGSVCKITVFNGKRSRVCRKANGQLVSVTPVRKRKRKSATTTKKRVTKRKRSR